MNPDLVEAAFGQAMTLVVLHRWGAARARLEQALEAYPDDAGVPHALARLLAAAPDERVRDGARALAMAGIVSPRGGGTSTWGRPWRWPWPRSAPSTAR